jgi:hypothetical protein
MQSSSVEIHNPKAVAGYLHPEYAVSLAEFGAPTLLRSSGGWLLERHIQQTPYSDATGCYPLFTCANWDRLDDDLKDVADRFVSVALVADPFGTYRVAELEECFPDRFFPFKKHYVIDLSQPVEAFTSTNHQRNAKKASSKLQVEMCENPMLMLEDWQKLYDTLIERHDIKGISTFSKPAFARQLSIPGMVAFRAIYQGDTVGMLLWYVQNQVGYYHLGAYSLQGYEHRSSFALFWFSINYFAEAGLEWLNLGGGAGLSSGEDDGLSRFKRGWATGVRTAYFCGRILDKKKYAELVRLRGVVGDDYFPLYRKGEFR